MAMLSGIQTALTGMKVSQSQMDIVGRNIANVDTVGYTRKVAQQKNVFLAGQNAGVTLGDITRNVNEGLLKSFLASNCTTGSLNAQSQYLGKAEILLGTPQGNNSLSANVADLQSAFETFASDVTSSAARYSLLNNANTVASRLNSLTQEIQKLRGDADLNISEACEQVNGYLDDIQRLNDQIVKYKVLNYEGVADLEDQRDEALRNLSGLIDLSYFTRENGEIVIQTTNGVTLLDRYPHYLSHSAVAQASPTTSYAGGGIGGIYVDGEDITNRIKNGEIKGLIEVRDTSLTALQSQLNELASVLKDSINQVHNRGTSYPNAPSSLSGTRDFINPDVQKIQIEGGDVRFTIFDADGKQVATTTLLGNLGMPAEGESVTDTISRINDWLQSPDGANLPQAYAQINADGNLVIETGDSNYSFSVMDEAYSTPGSEQKDVTVRFDVNGDGAFDRTMEGFSNFFGLNDFFISTANEAVYDSKVLSKNANLGVRERITLEFGTANNPNLGSINVYPNDSLQDIVNKINNNNDLNGQLKASLVPNGSGYVLQINNTSGEQLEINEALNAGATQTTGFLERIGMHPSNADTAGSIRVRDDLLTSPSLISAGSPEFNPNSGEYQLNPAANNIANDLAEAFATSQAFSQAGTLSSTQTTLSNYASTFVGNLASQCNEAESSFNYQSELTNSISLKEAKLSGVDMDEELAQLIIFQQSYAACAQTFTANKEMLDMLLNIL